MGEGRKKETLAGFFRSLSLEQRTAIEAVGLDMWDPFLVSILEHVPSAEEKMVFYRFHIAKHANDEGVDKVRKSEDRSCGRRGTRRSRGASTSGSTEGRTYRRSIGTGSPRSRRST